MPPKKRHNNLPKKRQAVTKKPDNDVPVSEDRKKQDTRDEGDNTSSSDISMLTDFANITIQTAADTATLPKKRDNLQPIQHGGKKHHTTDDNNSTPDIMITDFAISRPETAANTPTVALPYGSRRLLEKEEDDDSKDDGLLSDLADRLLRQSVVTDSNISGADNNASQSSSASSEDVVLADLAATLRRNLVSDNNDISNINSNLSQSSTDSDVPLSYYIRSVKVSNPDEPCCSNATEDSVRDVLPGSSNQRQRSTTGRFVSKSTQILDDAQPVMIEPAATEIETSANEVDIGPIVAEMGDLNMAEPMIVDDVPASGTDDEDGFEVPARRIVASHGAALMNQNERENVIAVSDIGRMRYDCLYCGALRFRSEIYTGSLCCSKGNVELPVLPECNETIFELLTTRNSEFRRHIRMYNASLSFASFQAGFDEFMEGPYVFRIHGTPSHTLASLEPQQGDRRNAQLYIVDNATASGLRAEAFPQCDPEILQRLDRLMREINPLCEALKMIHEVEQEERAAAERENRPVAQVTMVLKNRGGTELERRYDPPAANEIAVIFKGDYPKKLPNLKIYFRDSNFMELSKLSCHTDALAYPLMFQHGELGFCINTRHTNNQGNVSMREYYAYRMAMRNCFNVIMSCGRLTHQYIVDTWARTEHSRVTFIEQNQSRLRAELYTGLMDHLNRVADHERARVGKIVVLPSTFPNSPRCQYENYLDAITVFRSHGLPSYFITFTCNPSWTEVTDSLQSFESANDRPDILARVFRCKLNELIEDLTEKQIFGVSTTIVYSIEFQKRGLPHAHIVLGVANADDVHAAEDIDMRVWAEIPDETSHPLLYEVVKQHMIHGPCGTERPKAPCMAKGSCAKKFPKAFQTQTVFRPGGYPVYRRRDNGRSFLIRGSIVDNRHVVPYNPFLLLKYNAHINVEVCSGQKWIKYLFKYCFKGHDCLTVAFHHADDTRVVEHNECTTYLDSRYVSAPEAYWRLVSFPMVHKSHTVVKLPVHLPGQHRVVFNPENVDQVVQNENIAESMLTSFFKLNENDERARQYLYKEIPLHYTFNKSTKSWTRRRRQRKVTARLYEINVKDRERYCLKLLLSVVRGPKSYDDLKVVDGVRHDTFQQAALAMHLMDNSQDSITCMEEAAQYRMASSLRRLFVSICIYNDVDARQLWELYADDMSETFIRTRHMSPAEARNAALVHIDHLLRMNGSSCELQGLPVPHQIDVDVIDDDDDNGRDLRNEGAEDVIHVRDNLNEEQKHCYDNIMQAITRYVDGDRQTVKAFFIDGMGGSGKSFVYETILKAVRCSNQSAVAVAVSGIAATLLTGGQTAHSAFKLPLSIDENTSCNISVQSPEGQRLRDCSVVLWDEASMISCNMLGAVDRLLRDVTNTDCAFGGKVIVLGGDFRQILPIVQHGSRTQQVEACIKNSLLWCHFEIFRFSKNMRASNPEGEFSAWLEKLGDGKLDAIEYVDEQNRCVQLPDSVELPSKIIYPHQHLDDWVFDDMTDERIYSRAILCPRNIEVNEINERVLKKVEGEAYTFYSAHHQAEGLENNEEPLLLPVDYMESYTEGSLPNHMLQLKPNAVVMLLRNIDIRKGLCNGTRLRIEEIQANVLKCVVISGPHRNQVALIGRLTLTTSDPAVAFRRNQFPVKLSYAMTINKAQGQTFDRVGIHLATPVFSHGQLYVAFSRTRSFDDVRVTIVKTRKQGYMPALNKTVAKNIVLKEVL